MLDARTQLALIIILGGAAQWLAWRARVPSIVLLLFVGLIVGPILGIITPDAAIGPVLLPIVSLAVAIILFDGGLELSFREVREGAGVVWKLVTIGAIACGTIAAIAARVFLDVPWGLSAVIGAIVVVSGPTVVGPLLRHIRPSGIVGPILRWEGIVIDPIGVLLTLVVFEIVLQGDLGTAPGLIAGRTIITVLAGCGSGLIAAGLLILSLKKFWVPDQLRNPVSFMLVVCSYAAAEAVAHEAGLFAATVMGIALANQRRVDVKGLIEFTESLRVLLIAALFVVLAARLSPDDLRSLGWGHAAFLAVLVLVARPLTVALSTVKSKLTKHERLFLMAVAPRGIVAAAVSSVFAIRLSQAGLESGAILSPTVFFVIIGTVLIYGVAAPIIARRLGLADANPQGIVFAGAPIWARMLASKLQSLGVRVFLVDTSHPHITTCRFEQLPCHEGNVLSETTIEDIDLSGIGKLMACTSNPWVNALAAQRFERLFGRSEVYRVRCAEVESGNKAEPDAEPHARWLFPTMVNDALLEYLCDRGAMIHTHEVTTQQTVESILPAFGADAVPLVIIGKDKKLTVITEEKPRQLEPGDMVLVLGRVENDIDAAPSDRA